MCITLVLPLLLPLIYFICHSNVSDMCWAVCVRERSSYGWCLELLRLCVFALFQAILLCCYCCCVSFLFASFSLSVSIFAQAKACVCVHMREARCVYVFMSHMRMMPTLPITRTKQPLTLNPFTWQINWFCHHPKHQLTRLLNDIAQVMFRISSFRHQLNDLHTIWIIFKISHFLSTILCNVIVTIVLQSYRIIYFLFFCIPYQRPPKKRNKQDYAVSKIWMNACIQEAHGDDKENSHFITIFYWFLNSDLSNDVSSCI